jgi:hypothetical protein
MNSYRYWKRYWKPYEYPLPNIDSYSLGESYSRGGFLKGVFWSGIKGGLLASPVVWNPRASVKTSRAFDLAPHQYCLGRNEA